MKGRRTLGDAQEMIRVLRLSAEWADQLGPFVRDKYGELWQAAWNNPSEP